MGLEQRAPQPDPDLADPTAQLPLGTAGSGNREGKVHFQRALAEGLSGEQL